MFPTASLAPSSPVHATTVIAVARDGRVAMAGDGQVTMGDAVVKGAARKVRLLQDGKILAGFAGAVADAFTLFSLLEGKLERWPTNLSRTCVELAKEWRTDRFLRRLEALLVVCDRDHLFLVGGDGNVIEPDDPVIAIGSGGGYALAAARALSSRPPIWTRPPSPAAAWRSPPTSASSPTARSRSWNFPLHDRAPRPHPRPRCSGGLAHAPPALPRSSRSMSSEAPTAAPPAPSPAPAPSEAADDAAPAWIDDLTPRQIVAELDKYIVGQADAKKAVAIALRNRWRRQRVEDDLREEILPTT